MNKMKGRKNTFLKPAIVYIDYFNEVLHELSIWVVVGRWIMAKHFNFEARMSNTNKDSNNS